MFRKGLTVAVILLFIGMCVVPSTAVQELKDVSTVSFDGNILYVGGSGPNNYTTIQGAVNDAVDGDIVFVYNGTYYETNTVINKSIDVIGEDRTTTFIDGIDDLCYLLFLQAEEINISNFTLQNAFTGIVIESTCLNFVISKNIIRNHNRTGIFINPEVEGRRIIENNQIYSNHQAGILAYSSHNTIRDNSLWSNGGGYENCHIYVRGSQNIVSGNIINNSVGDGILIMKGESNSVVGNTVSNCSVGISLAERSMRNNISSNSLNNNGKGVSLYTGSLLNTIYHNNFIDNEISAGFVTMAFYNQWDENFWDKPRYLPYPIIGRLGLLFIPWINIDWHPASEPYNIGV